MSLHKVELILCIVRLHVNYIPTPADLLPELVLRATNDLSLFGKLSYKLLQSVVEAQSFDANPIYAILHEQCYCQGCVILLRFLSKTSIIRRAYI